MYSSDFVTSHGCIQPLRRQRKVREEEKVGDGEKEREKECREEREKASQTDCLAAPGSPALSVI